MRSPALSLFRIIATLLSERLFLFPIYSPFTVSPQDIKEDKVQWSGTIPWATIQREVLFFELNILTQLESTCFKIYVENFMG